MALRVLSQHYPESVDFAQRDPRTQSSQLDISIKSRPSEIGEPCEIGTKEDGETKETVDSRSTKSCKINE